MFSLSVVDTDLFCDLPLSTQALYFHLGMHGDDDGFVDSTNKIIRSIGCTKDDLVRLEAAKFIICFENGVVAIRDWLLNNNLRNDRYTATRYQEEYARLVIVGKRYHLIDTDGIQDDNQPDTDGIPNITEHSLAEQRQTEPNETGIRASIEDAHNASKTSAIEKLRNYNAF